MIPFQISLDYPPILIWFKAVYAHVEGVTDDSSTHLSELQNDYKKGSSDSPTWFIALYYAYIEDYDKAFDWLQNSHDRH